MSETICEHGSQKRKCPICECNDLQDEIDELKAYNKSELKKAQREVLEKAKSKMYDHSDSVRLLSILDKLIKEIGEGE